MTDAAFIDSLKAPAPIPCHLLRVDLRTGQTIKWVDGGFADWGLERFESKHQDFGTVSGIGAVSDGVGSSYQRLEITIQPDSAVGMAALGAPGNQGSRVRFWVGSIDGLTGALIGQPKLRFDGSMDRPALGVGDGWELRIECGTQAERLIEPSHERRLNNPAHQGVWPGERGCEYVVDNPIRINWRNGSSSAITYTGGTTTGGGYNPDPPGGWQDFIK